MKGYSLSPVQEFGLEVLYFLEGQEKQKREVDAVRQAMLSTGNVELRELYPEYFTDEPPSDASNDSEKTVFDYGAVKWESPSDKGVQEFERLQSQMRLNQAISLSGELDELPPIDTQGFVLNLPDDSEWI